VETVVVSSRFRIVIPKAIRTALGICPGQKLQVIQYEDRIELIPTKPVREMRGFLKGIDTTVEREPDRVERPMKVA
jgi:AbrB family looped-hinge helix DNA binding protein